MTALGSADSRKKSHAYGNEVICTAYVLFLSYVGIIQIRLWVEATQLPLSSLPRAPLFNFQVHYSLFSENIKITELIFTLYILFATKKDPKAFILSGLYHRSERGT